MSGFTSIFEISNQTTMATVKLDLKKFLIDGIVSLMNCDVDMSRVQEWTKSTMNVIGAKWNNDPVILEAAVNGFLYDSVQDYFFDKINRQDVDERIVTIFAEAAIKFPKND